MGGHVIYFFLFFCSFLLAVFIVLLHRAVSQAMLFGHANAEGRRAGRSPNKESRLSWLESGRSALNGFLDGRSGYKNVQLRGKSDLQKPWGW